MSIGCIRAVVAASFAAVIGLSGVAQATSMVALSDEDLSHIAEVIVVARVEKVQSGVRFKGERRTKQITTSTTVEVLEAWKGPHKSGDRLSVREVGGRVDREMIAVPGTAGFLIGERVLLFLEYKASSNEYGLVGWVQGKYTLLANGTGGWDVAKLSIPVPEWGAVYDAKKHAPITRRGDDLATMAASVRKIVKADLETGADWREMPKYRGFSGRGGAK